MQKWGTNRNGSVRFRCSFCGKSQTRKRVDLRQKYRQQLFGKWLLSKQSLDEIAKLYGIKRQTLHSWFTPFWQITPLPSEVDIRDKVIIIDGKGLERNATVLIASTPNQVASWMFAERENATSWSVFLGNFKHIPFAIVCDGQRGMLKTIKEVFPRVIVQRCQFHVISYCQTKLTKKPESEAAQELRLLVGMITGVKTKQQLKEWFFFYRNWYQAHHEFLKEKTYQEYNLTPTGRKRWHYTHGKLHAAHSHLRNSLPNLFKYLLYPQIPNTTNFVEGAINSQLQEKLRFHRGLNLPKRQVLTAHFLASKQVPNH